MLDLIERFKHIGNEVLESTETSVDDVLNNIVERLKDKYKV